MSIAHDHGGHGPYTVEDLHAREDEGRGLELEDGWLVKLSPNMRHNIAYERLRDIIRAAAREAGASVHASCGGDWEIETTAGIRKPDVLVVPRNLADSWFDGDCPATIAGQDLLLAVEVVSPRSGSEGRDRFRKPQEYAAMGIPQFWLVDYKPEPIIQVFVLDEHEAATGKSVSAYRLDQSAKAGDLLEVDVPADKPFTVRFDPQILAKRPSDLTDL
ncbi:Uma2 family endonuclease [Actinomadura sp. 6K520]|uniref:Uma2 family endonuclease n=1 Tax=Actinomadura sp. 6K520 TaxID=2530364 RepID=UPI001404BEF5|nr:Uma2 family endonuclease [Actinomadura sp. 6K520]